MLQMLLRSSALVLLMGAVFSPLEAGRIERGSAEEDGIIRSVPSKKKGEENEEKEVSLSNALNLGLDIDENTALPKGWNLVDSAKKRDINKPLSLKKKNKGVELLGDNYTFYTDVPGLKNFDKTTFVFSVNIRSTTPGVYIQYYDGKNAVSSTRYANKKGQWETLNIEFTVDANARFHRLYSAILGTVKGNDKPSVDINNITLQQKQIVEQKVDEPKDISLELPSRKAPDLPPRTNEKTFLDISQPLRSVPTEVRQEELFSLSKALNSGFDMDEKTTLPKGWNLVDSAKNRDNNKPISLKKKPKGIEILGDNYTFYTDVSSLKNFDKSTFVFSADVRSTTPGVHLQYYDGKNVVNSIPYTSKKGEWQTLNIEFIVDANAKFHRLYSAILGTVKGNDKPSVDLNNIKLQRKEPPIALFEPEEKKKTVVGSDEKAPELPPRVVVAEKKAPELPPRVVGAEKKAPERPKAHPLANLLSGAKPLKVTSKVEEKKEKSLSIFEQTLDQRRSVIIEDDLSDDEDKYTSDIFEEEKESVPGKLSLDGEIQQNENRILEIEKKIEKLTPIASSPLMGGFTPKAIKHDKERANAKGTIRALEKEKAVFEKTKQELVIQKQEEEAQKKRDEEESRRKKEVNLTVQKKLAIMKNQAKKESSPGIQNERIQKAHLLLKKTGNLPVIDQSQEANSRGPLLSQIGEGRALKKTGVVHGDTSLEISRKEIEERKRAQEKENEVKRATDEFLKKKREEMIRLEEEQEKERKKRGDEPERKDEEWD